MILAAAKMMNECCLVFWIFGDELIDLLRHGLRA
jgi:hypothetical protein